MVEMCPSRLKLFPGVRRPANNEFDAAMSGVRFSYVDLITRNEDDGDRWINNNNSICFELRRPSVCEMASLICNLARLKPDEIDFMFSGSEQCLVYFLRWNDEEIDVNNN